MVSRFRQGNDKFAGGVFRTLSLRHTRKWFPLITPKTLSVGRTRKLKFELELTYVKR